MSWFLEASYADVPVWTIAVIGAIVLVGAIVQATIGLGLGMLGAPLIALMEPELVPTLLLLLAVPISTAVLVVERHQIDWRVVAWALPARVPGIFLGVWLVTAIAGRWLGVAVAVMVLVAVALTLHTVEVRQTPATLVGAGFLAGTAGTAVAVGGPPMAIVMAHRPPREVRGTLSFFFVVGSVLSVGWFAVLGELPRSSIVLALVYVPLLLVAIPAGAWANHRLPRERFRRGVLALCAVSAVVLLVRSGVG
ncbi:MAG: sulfite exporter TauE/SafE family protein [Nocardioides sp.]|nr:sulfite exporter TauE/SafE family protein [Nocardioides sp.]